MFTLQSLTNVFSIIGVSAALVVYVVNSMQQRKNLIIQNIEHYHKLHSQAFSADSYAILNVAAMEKGEYKRDLSDKAMELKFNRFLADMEWLALYQSTGAVPSSINAYMVGYFAMHIFPELTDREKAEPHWALAVEFLKETAKQAKKMREFSTEELLTYIKTNHFK